jgi:hypothetical protein
MGNYLKRVKMLLIKTDIEAVFRVCDERGCAPSDCGEQL